MVTLRVDERPDPMADRRLELRAELTETAKRETLARDSVETLLAQKAAIVRKLRALEPPETWNSIGAVLGVSGARAEQISKL